MAKFKIGDVVSVKREAAEMIDNPALARKRGRVTKVLPGGYYEVDGELGATGMELTDAELTLANSRACNSVRSRNAAPSAQLKRAYDEWKKAAEKFKKWFGAGRRLSERVPDSADETRRMIDFSNLFFKETGRRPPNGYGEMTLEQMLSSNSQTCVRSRNSVVAKALNACGTARNAWGDETQVNGLITKMLGLINKVKPIAQQLYDTAFDLDDAGSVWLGQNKGSKNAQKVKVAVERANKVMKHLANFTSGLD